MKRAMSVGLILVLLVVLSGCASSAGPSSNGELAITVSILPQSFFVEKVAGDRATVTVMVQPGASPATYEPRAEQLVALAGADAYLSIGVAFEDAWMDRITSANEDMLIVDTAVGIERRPIEEHEHEGEDDHEEGELLDPHVWLSPELVKVQAANIRDALVSLDPGGEQVYDANLDAFLKEIDVLQRDIIAGLEGAQSRSFMVFHPSWGYFADEFGLNMIAIEVGGQEPSAQEMKSIIDEAVAEDIHVVFAQPEFSTQSAETIAAQIDGEVILISPLAYDWSANMREVSTTLAQVLN